MLIRKNTKSFRTIQELIISCRARPDRQRLVRLYITKAGNTIRERISVESIKGDGDLFYEMGYQTVLSNLGSANHQLHVSDEVPGIYFFHSNSNKVWDESPFEFDEEVGKIFSSTPDLPVLRKKEKAHKIPVSSAPSKKEASVSRKTKIKAPRIATDPDTHPRPRFKLLHPVRFTHLDKLVYHQAGLTKLDVLEYYNEVSEYALPHLKGRELSVRGQLGNGRPVGPLNREILYKDQIDESPAWLSMASGKENRKSDGVLLCNKREDLLLYIEKGCYEFSASLSMAKRRDNPDYIVLLVDAAESDLSKGVEVALAAREIFTALRLPAFVKTAGTGALHIYISLDRRSDFAAGKQSAESICKLIRLKVPDLATLKGHDRYQYGKVLVDYSLNEVDAHIIAPYCLHRGDSPIVATPLQWDEVNDRLKPEEFNLKNIPARLKRMGDPFEGILHKKANAQELVTRLSEHYSFLF